MRLYVDAGNSFVKWRVGLEDGPAGQIETIASTGTTLLERWRELPRPTQVVGVNVAGEVVQRRIEAVVSALWQDSVNWLFVRDGALGLRCGYRDPTRLGTDRWAAMLGAIKLCPESAVLIADCGTALTVDVLDGTQHRGGIIVPGLALMKSALGNGTADLAGALNDYEPSSDAWLGDGTDSCVRVGALAAVSGAIQTIATRLTQEGDVPQCLLTGGGAQSIAPWLGIGWRLEPDLVFVGLQHWADGGIDKVQ